MHITDKKIENMFSTAYPQWRTIIVSKPSKIVLARSDYGGYFGNADINEDAVLIVSYVECLF